MCKFVFLVTQKNKFRFLHSIGYEEENATKFEIKSNIFLEKKDDIVFLRTKFLSSSRLR